MKKIDLLGGVMTYAGNRLIYDADSHLMELPDFLSSHASADILDTLPNLKKSLTYMQKVILPES